MMKVKNYITLIISVLCSSMLFAGPGTYYNSIDTNKTCASLKTALFNLISSNTIVLPYGQVDNYYNQTDLKPAEAGGGYVIVDRYCSENPNGVDYCSFRYPTNFCLTTPSDTLPCNCYNKEHVFPKSWWGTEVYPMYSDMHFIWPADNRINFYKSNFPIGYEKNAYYTSKNGTRVGASDPAKNFGYSSSNIFEPIDTFKGDFARAYLYVVTRYQDSIINWLGRSTSAEVLDGNKYPGLKSWILQLCVKWSKMDPPSAFEIKRNDSVYSIQGNRNPYIDHPNWVEKVFGPDGNYAACVSTGIRENRSLGFSVYPNPVNDAVLNIRTATALTEEATIEIADILGRVVQTQKLNPGAIPSIDVSTLVKGIYFINIMYKDSNDVSTFIKE